MVAHDVNPGPTRRFFRSSASSLSKDYPPHSLLPFPALSPTMEVGTISKWELSEGDSFSAGSVICSIETDKATMDFEAQDDGILARILREGPAAVDLPIGSTIAIIVEEAGDVAAFADYVLEAAAVPAVAPAVAGPSAPAVSMAEAAVPAAGGGGGEAGGTSLLLPSARFLSESKYVRHPRGAF